MTVDSSGSNSPPPTIVEAPKRSNDSVLDLILIIALGLIGLLLLEEVRPDLIARWLRYPFSTDVEALSQAIINQESSANFVAVNPDSGAFVEALSQAIINQESSANFVAVNPDSGALGYAQIMPENLPLWSREALGYEITPDQFLANPDLQKQIIEHRITLYWQEALMDSRGDREKAILMVASRWYSGDPYLYDSTQAQFYNAQEYPSIAEYSQSVLRQWERQRHPWELD